MPPALKTTNNLEFYSAEWDSPVISYPPWQLFKIGTCHGQWRANNGCYEILGLVNKEKGNGHFNDVFEWFEFSCKRDGYDLKILEVWNKRLKKHLIKKKVSVYPEKTM